MDRATILEAVKQACRALEFATAISSSISISIRIIVSLYACVIVLS